MRYNRITDKQIARGTQLLAEGKSWREIAAEVGTSHDGIRRRVDPKYRATKLADSARGNLKRKYNYDQFASTGVSADVDSGRKSIPDMVLRERNQAFAEARSLTASVFGDPLPGRSALDKRNAERSA